MISNKTSQDRIEVRHEDEVSALNVSWVIESFDHIIGIVSVHFIVVNMLWHP